MGLPLVNRTPGKSISNPLPSQTAPLFLHCTPEGTVIRIRIRPGAKKTNWVGIMDGEIKITVQAPPVEGAANREVVQFLADRFEVKRSEVVLIKGEKSRSKVFLLKGLKREKCLALIPFLDQNQNR